MKPVQGLVLVSFSFFLYQFFFCLVARLNGNPKNYLAQPHLCSLIPGLPISLLGIFPCTNIGGPPPHFLSCPAEVPAFKPSRCWTLTCGKNSHFFRLPFTLEYPMLVAQSPCSCTFFSTKKPLVLRDAQKNIVLVKFSGTEQFEIHQTCFFGPN